jgi:endonuclease/exonuclease/phosphatase family metal-dependent hydrolase
LLLLGCGQPPLKARAPTPGVPHFTVVSYNVEYNKYGSTPTVEAVGAADADIVCLQETGGHWAEVLRAAYSKRYAYVLHYPDGHPTGAMTVLSRYPVTDLGVQAAPSGWHPAWHLLVDSPVGPLQILNLHLRPTFSGEGDPVSSYVELGTDHVTEIVAFTGSDQTEPITLVLGDFNEGPDGKAVRWLEDRGFSDVVPLFHPGQQTWRSPSLADQFDAAVDHILFDSRLAPLNAEVLIRGESDHLPVVASFELADPQAAGH